MREERSVERRDSRRPRPLEGLRGLRPSDLPREISAGITLAALMVPLNIGYAQVMGLPPVAGLYTAIFPLAVFALLSTSRHVVASPDASISAMVGATLVVFGASGDPARIEAGFAFALLCGLIFFAFWFFRLAFLANFVSRAVMAGFITGLAIEVLTNQLRRILAAGHDAAPKTEALAAAWGDSIGGSFETEGFFLHAMALVESIPAANVYSIGIGVGALLMVRLFKRYAPRVPGALVALVVLTVLVAVLELDKRGVSVLGEVPSAAPEFKFPALPPADYFRLLPGAFAIAAITLCERLLLARQYSRKHGYKTDGNQEIFACGAANVAAGLTGSIMIGNSPSRSAAMDSAGAKTQLPSLVASGTITLVILFFSDLLAYLPTAVLAGIVANAVLSLIEVKELRALWRMRRSDFWIAMVCLLGVLVLGALKGVVIAVLMAIIDVVRRASRPGTWALRQAPDGRHFVAGEVGPEANDGGLVIYRFGAPLYFANANLFMEEVERLVGDAPTPVRWFVLDAEAMTDIDTTGAEAFEELLELLADRNVTFAMSRANKPVPAVLERYGLLEKVGMEHIFPTNRHVWAAFQEAGDGVIPPSSPPQNP